MGSVVNKGVSSRPFGCDFVKLDEVTSGRYNKGELRLDGDGQFEKVNNFVWHTDKNNTILTNDQNVDVRKAVFDCLNAKFTPNGNRLDDVRNFLLGAEFRTSTLSRDEVHNLIKLFKNAGNDKVKWKTGMDNLRMLAEYKHGVAGQSGNDRKVADKMLKGNGIFFQDSIRKTSETSVGIRASGVKFFDPGKTSFVAYDSESMIAQLDKWQSLRDENNIVVDYIARNGQRIVVGIPKDPTPDTMLQIGGEACKLSEFVGRGTFRLQPKIEQRGDGTFVMNDFNTMKERIGEWRKLEGFSVNVAFGFNGWNCNIVIPRNVEVSPDLQFQIMGQDHKLSELVGKGRFYLQPKAEQPQPQIRQQQQVNRPQPQPQINQVQVNRPQDLKTLEASIARTLQSGRRPYFFDVETQLRVDVLDMVPGGGKVRVRMLGEVDSVEYEMNIAELPKNGLFDEPKPQVDRQDAEIRQSPSPVQQNRQVDAPANDVRTQSPGSGTCFLWSVINGIDNARRMKGKDLYQDALNVLEPDKDGNFTTFDSDHKRVRESVAELENELGKGDRCAKAYLDLVRRNTDNPIEKLWLYKSYREDFGYRRNFERAYVNAKGDMTDQGMPAQGAADKSANWLGLKWDYLSNEVSEFDSANQDALVANTKTEKLLGLQKRLDKGDVIVVNMDRHYEAVVGCDPDNKTLTCADSISGRIHTVDLSPGKFHGRYLIDIFTQHEAENELTGEVGQPPPPKVEQQPINVFAYNIHKQTPRAGCDSLWCMVNDFDQPFSDLKNTFSDKLHGLEPQDGKFTTFDENGDLVEETLAELETKILEGDEIGFAGQFLELSKLHTKEDSAERLWLYKSYLEDPNYRQAFVNRCLDQGNVPNEERTLPPAVNMELSAKWCGLRKFTEFRLDPDMMKSDDGQKNLKKVLSDLSGRTSMNAVTIQVGDKHMAVCKIDGKARTVSCINPRSGEVENLSLADLKESVKFEVFVRNNAKDAREAGHFLSDWLGGAELPNGEGTVMGKVSADLEFLKNTDDGYKRISERSYTAYKAQLGYVDGYLNANAEKLKNGEAELAKLLKRDEGRIVKDLLKIKNDLGQTNVVVGRMCSALKAIFRDGEIAKALQLPPFEPPK